MLTTLNGMFSKPKPHKIDFIKENKKKLKEISSMVNQNQSKSRFNSAKSKCSQTEVSRINSSIALKENKSSTPSGCKLNSKGSMAVFLLEKKDKGSSSNVSLSAKQKSSRKGMHKNQFCQTIDPRRCDQLFHEGVIKYPSSKILQELADIEKQKAKRYDAHVKKEYFKRNRIKLKSPPRLIIPKMNFNIKMAGKGDEIDVRSSDREEHNNELVVEIEKNDDVVKEEKKEEEREAEEELEDEETDKAKVEESTEEKEADAEEEEEREEKNENKKEEESSKASVKEYKVERERGPALKAAEIIKQTTEDHIKYTPKIPKPSEHVPNSKGDAKSLRRYYKKPLVEEEQNDILKKILDPQCPPGHIPLPDEERKKTLHMLRVSHAELIRELNLLPVRADTLRVRQRKIQLENQLNKIEEGIKVFNKSKVYVKIEE